LALAAAAAVGGKGYKQKIEERQIVRILLIETYGELRSPMIEGMKKGESEQ
jgi:hypothetical protein